MVRVQSGDFLQKRIHLQCNGIDVNNSMFSKINIEYYRLKWNLTDDITTTSIHHVVIKILHFYNINFNAIMVILDSIVQKPGTSTRRLLQGTWEAPSWHLIQAGGTPKLPDWLHPVLIIILTINHDWQATMIFYM